MTTVVITRHGHVEGIDPPRFRGRDELELSPLGRQQIKALADRLAGEFQVDQIYSSPLRRCIATAEAIAAAVHAPVEGTGELLDLDYGEWQGKTHAKMGELYPELLARWYATPHLVRFPKGESLQDLAVRAADLLRAVRQRHPEGTVVLVGHDSIDRVLMLQLLDMPLASYWRLEHQPCSVSVVELGDRRTKLTLANDVSHLATLK